MTKGAQVQTRETFLYGRFECMMKPAYGSGVVSSFFTFFDGPDWEKNWNEIDFEFLGRHTNTLDTNVIHTNGGVTDKNINVRHHTLDSRASDKFFKLCIEWLPDRVLWKINDITFRTLKVVLNKPQKLMMNLWVGAPGWAGEFNPGILPQEASYEYVRISRYASGAFPLAWQDSFSAIDEKRWQIVERKATTTDFVKENVSIRDGKLVLRLIP